VEDRGEAQRLARVGLEQEQPVERSVQVSRVGMHGRHPSPGPLNERIVYRQSSSLAMRAPSDRARNLAHTTVG
jgi:hypothetical protein